MKFPPKTKIFLRNTNTGEMLKMNGTVVDVLKSVAKRIADKSPKRFGSTYDEEDQTFVLRGTPLSKECGITQDHFNCSPEEFLTWFGSSVCDSLEQPNVRLGHHVVALIPKALPADFKAKGSSGDRMPGQLGLSVSTKNTTDGSPTQSRIIQRVGDKLTTPSMKEVTKYYDHLLLHTEQYPKIVEAVQGMGTHAEMSFSVDTPFTYKHKDAVCKYTIVFTLPLFPNGFIAKLKDRIAEVEKSDATLQSSQSEGDEVATPVKPAKQRTLSFKREPSDPTPEDEITVVPAKAPEEAPVATPPTTPKRPVVEQLPNAPRKKPRPSAPKVEEEEDDVAPMVEALPATEPVPVEAPEAAPVESLPATESVPVEALEAAPVSTCVTAPEVAEKEDDNQSVEMPAVDEIPVSFSGVISDEQPSEVHDDFFLLPPVGSKFKGDHLSVHNLTVLVREMKKTEPKFFESVVKQANVWDRANVADMLDPKKLMTMKKGDIDLLKFALYIFMKESECKTEQLSEADMFAAAMFGMGSSGTKVLLPPQGESFEDDGKMTIHNVTVFTDTLMKTHPERYEMAVADAKNKYAEVQLGDLKNFSIYYKLSTETLLPLFAFVYLFGQYI